MDPIALIRRELGVDEADAKARRHQSISPSLRCPFARVQLFDVRGHTSEFDFPTLPNGSMAVFAAIENEVIRLTREGKEIERVLAVEWDGLNSIDPVELSSTILRFYDAGIKATHAVLRDESDLHSRCEGPRGYELNDAELSNCRDQIGNTQSWMEEDCFYLRAITLCGWMHVRSNLGIEYLTIRRNGTVQQRQRKVLSKQIFSRFPQIRY